MKQFFAIVVVCLVFGGCGPQTAREEPRSQGRSIAAVFQTLDNPFFVECNEGIKEVVSAHGDHLITLDSGWVSRRQEEQISELLDQGVSAVFLNPVNWKDVNGSLLKAQQRGVPCVIVDAPVKSPDLVVCQIASDNVEAGRLAARALRNARQSAKIVILHIRGNKACIDRIAGFEQELASRPDMEILEIEDGKGTAERSLPVMQELLAKHSDLDAVFAVNDPSAMGVISALENAGRLRDVTVVSVDGSAEGIAAVKAGKLYSTAVQFPREIGRIAAQRFYEHSSGETVEKEIRVPLELITVDNVHAFAEVP
ncbi:substrate-binding domain-containing protein [Bremerella sp. JC770]|uniref:substrate-binding domain-containing protein n=1 Tax=Bremerella sp. JC770 TaxID=3232137 RepID=UPI00345A9653